MAEPVILEVNGLQLSNNTFSASPPGSTFIASNVVINQKGVAQPRNGQAFNATLATAATIPFALTEFQEQVIVNYATGKTSTSYGLGYVNSGSVTAYSGTYNPVDDDGVATDYGRMKFAQAAQFLHFCTQAGPKTLETYNGTPREAGLLQPLDGVAFMANSTDVPFSSNNPVPYNSSVAYRYVIRRPTSTGVSLLGPPSNRIVVTNRILVPIGGLTKAGGTATAVLPSSYDLTNPTQLQIGDTFDLTPGEANFPAGTYTVASTPTTHSFTFAITAGSATNTVAQDCDTGPRGAEVEVSFPTDAQVGDAVRLYRSQATSLSTIEPGDELKLCAEHYITSGDLAGGFTFVDATPPGVPVDPLYTNPTVEGPTSANFQPPLYRDVTNYDGITWYANTTGQYSLACQILGVGAPDGIQDGDTMTIDDGNSHVTTFTFKNSPSGSTQIQIVSDGLPSYNIAWTCQLFCAAASAYFKSQSIGIALYGSTSPTGNPGNFLIQRTDFGPKFQVKASRPKSWTPALSSSTYTASTNDRQPNGLAYSKSAEPEAVPVVNFLNIGSANYNLDRIFGLRNALILCKEGDGIWALTGQGGNYSLQQISTANIIAPDCAAVFADNAWVYTDQGILRVSDTGGVTVVSRPIETVINQLAAQFPNETFAWSFAVPYEIERRIHFYVPVNLSGPAGIPQLEAYCYSLATNAWTKFNAQAYSGVVTSAHRLWLGQYDSAFSTYRITKERKDIAYTDFADGSWTNTLTTTADPLVVALSTAGNIGVGDGISQTIGGTVYRAKIAAVNGDGTYDVSETVPWANGSCTIYNRYAVELQFLPQGQPATRQTLTRLATLYKPQEFANYYGKTTLETDQIQAELEIPTPHVGFGLTPFGQGSFGNPCPQVVDTNPIAPQWTNAGQFYPGFKLDEVWTAWKLQGLYAMLERASGPVGRGK